MTRRIYSIAAVLCLPLWASKESSALQMHHRGGRQAQGPPRRSEYSSARGQSVRDASSGNRLPHVSRRLQEADPFKGCDKDKKGTCAPTASPSGAPSGQPSISFQPTVSPMPSAAPSTSVAPSFVPSPFPSSNPSDQPSGVPTITARPSSTPSRAPSDAPSAVPSIAPTPKPTETPTHNPTEQPSASPSLSQRPTITPQPTNTNYPTVDPNGYSTVVFIGPNRLPEKNSTCRPAIPSAATSVTNQVIAFDYVANVDPGSNITLAVSSISLRLQDELARQYLSCHFPPGEDFYTHSINSLPGDVVSTTSSCSSSQVVGNSDCYVVNGAFTAVIFYLPKSSDSGSGSPSNRRLQDAGTTSTNITDPNVYQSFSQSLDDIFASGALQTAQVTGLQFEAVVNNASPGPPSQQSANTGAIVGGIIGGLVLLILVAFAVYTIVRTNDRRRRYPQQVGPDDEDSLNRPYEDDPSAQEDQPFAHIPKTSSPDDRSDQQRQQQRPDDEDEESLSLARNVRVVVVNEDESLLSGVPPPVGLYDDEAPDDEPKPPRFYKMRELGSPSSAQPSPTYYQPNPGRSYDVSDTVDL